MNYTIRARNSLDVPIRLTITNSNEQILITIGHEEAALKDFYLVCVDTDLLPGKEWQEIGLLNISMKSQIAFQAKAEGRE